VGDWPATDPASDASAAREVIAASRLVLDALPRAITVLDGDGMIVGWNQVSEHSYGWTSAEAVGRSMYELMTPPDLRVLARSIVETVMKGESWSGPVTVALRDGTTRSTSSLLSPLRSLHGDIIGVVCAGRRCRR
jgi:PAS domain S-box-containing protein